MSFNKDFTTYTLTEMYPARPAYNFLWNENFIAQINQFGMGSSWHYTDDGMRTNMNCAGNKSDLGTITDNRIIFIRDNDTNENWAANRNYKNAEFAEFKTIVGQGVSTIISEYNGIKTSFKLFIPETGIFECWQVTVENYSDIEKNISLFPYANSSISSLAHNACSDGYYNNDINGIILENNSAENRTILNKAYFISDINPDAYETTDRRFRGVYGNIAEPDAVKKGELASNGTSFDWLMIFALQFNLKLQAKEIKTINIINGIAENIEDINKVKKESLNQEYFDAELAKLNENSIERNKKVWINTGDEQIDAFANSWLKQQVSLGKTWGRVYGKGFRDILQDCTAVVSFDAKAAKKNIIACLEHQYEDGNNIRQWNSNWTHPYRDGASWIFPAVTGYIKETADYAILDIEVKYLNSEKSGTILEHCFKGIDFLLDNLGARGLCLWGGGDWNDSLNRAGLENKGESVWLSEATVFASNLFIELLKRIDKCDEANIILNKTETLKNNILKNGWDKNYFLMGINDKDEKIGSCENDAGKLFLNTQTWAVLANIAKEPNKLMDLVEDNLTCDFGTLLAKPAYSKSDDYIGAVTYMNKGCCENGSVYNHAVAFKIVADCKLGRAEEAYKSLKKLLPGNHSSGCEPYVVVNQYLGPENPFRVGEANGTWITGTAGWVYRAITEYMIGIQADYDGLKVRPCLPKEWDNITAKRFFRGKKYKIKISHSQNKENPYNITINN